MVHLGSATLPSLVTAALSAPIGWALSRTAQALAGPKAASAGWMGAGVIGLSFCLLVRPEQPILSLTLGLSLLVLTAADLASLRLPDLVTLPLSVVGLGASALTPSVFPDHLAGFVVGIISLWAIDHLYFRLRGRTGIGFGDAKLFGLAGAWLGWRALPTVLLLACASALVWIATRILRQGQSALSEPVAFGAPLCAAIWFAWLCR